MSTKLAIAQDLLRLAQKARQNVFYAVMVCILLEILSVWFSMPFILTISLLMLALTAIAIFVFACWQVRRARRTVSRMLLEAIYG